MPLAINQIYLFQTIILFIAQIINKFIDTEAQDHRSAAQIASNL